ncbi:MAG: ATP-binding protein [Halioglobus sp.]
MTLPGNLFIKIFLGFWLVSVAILGSWLITAQYFESIPQSNDIQSPKGPPPRFMLQLIYNLQNRSFEELPDFLQSAREKHDIEVFLLDRNGKDLFERELMPHVLEASRKVQGQRRRAVVEMPDYKLLAHSMYRYGQGQLTAVIVYKPLKPGLINTLRQNLYLRIVMAIIVSGVICFILSRILTNRFKRLQQASRELAGGDLDTRIAVTNSGGDETDELARDFNAMAEKIQQQVVAQKRLLGDVSHELRSPIARLRIALALAEQDDKNRVRHMARIDHETVRLEELIGQLLSSQSDSGRVTLDAHLDLVGLLTELCDDASFEGKASGKRVEFNTEVAEAVIASHGDLLHKAFDNILRNALKYTDANSTVHASLELRGDEYQVRIEDTGPGVPEQELTRLFEEFYRVDTARPRETGGYGLGLAIAKRAIEQHSGTIRAENTASGLIVTVQLPAN